MPKKKAALSRTGWTAEMRQIIDNTLEDWAASGRRCRQDAARHRARALPDSESAAQDEEAWADAYERLVALLSGS